MKKNFAATIFAITFCCLTAGATGEAPKTDPEAQKRTIADLRNVGTAMFSWLTDQVGAAAAGQSQTPEPASANLSDYPAISREDLAKILVPNYIQEVPELDGWGHPYEFHLNTANPLAPKVMAVRSPGRDGQYSGDTYKIGPFGPERFDDDLVWVDGFFVQWPGKPEN
jgi:hypothetical protein